MSATPDRPDVLVIAPRLPCLPSTADRGRTIRLLQYLSQRASVHLACRPRRPLAEEAVAALLRCCARVAVTAPRPAANRPRAGGPGAPPEGPRPGTLFGTVRAWAQATRFHAA